jgi:hypothetical protein
MIGGLPLAFAQPLVLLGLLSLPLLWWLLRLIPPRPRRVDFPPTRMLFDIAPKEETPSRTPWWLTLLRLVLAALVILAAAGPQWNPAIVTSGGPTPLALLIDDGWAAASTWDVRMRAAEDLVTNAENDKRGVAVLPLSEPLRDVSIATAGAARVRLQQLKPKPHAVQRAEALPMIERLLAGAPDMELVWLSDGIELGQGKEFVEGLARIVGQRKLSVVEGGLSPAHALTGAENTAGALTVKVLRAESGASESGILRALDLKGLSLGEARYAFSASDLETEAEFQLPVEIRNDIARIEVAGQRSSGAVQLLDKRWKRRAVGVISGTTSDTAQPLLASTYYLSRALNPFADVRPAESAAPAEAIAQFVDQNVSVMILADVGNVTGEAREKLTRWLEDGGVLVRFAGPRLAASEDDLVPVRLRRGGRTLGGSLSWDQPQQLASFSRESPFNGMTVPNDVTVSRQVLAEPDADLSDRTWASLADGTPLVTAARRGKGVVVLFHVTGDTRWSNLPLSGSFVDMLKRTVDIAGTTAGADKDNAEDKQASREMVPPTRVLDGFGAFVPPPPSARPIPVNFSNRADAEHPPGYYGPGESQIAVNALKPADRLARLDFSPLNTRPQAYRLTEPRDLRGPVLLAALGLLLLDALLVFWLAGGIARLTFRRRPATAMFAIAVLAAALAVPPRAFAQNDDFAAKSSLRTHLAYVITGDAEVDRISRLGLEGLTQYLAQRTALEPGAPIGVEIGRDDLAFFSLLYWPVAPGAPKPSAQAMARLDAYMKQGGTVLFDTRDALEAPPDSESSGPGMMALREILSSLDIPELEPVSSDHVLTKTFFLLRDFPGRFNSGRLWVEALPAADEEQADRPARASDGVSSIIITSNDLAGAWAIRSDGQSMLPLMPGEPRQREFAFRAGVNIVMYTLTGNYKADQVHVPALLERLGQ